MNLYDATDLNEEDLYEFEQVCLKNDDLLSQIGSRLIREVRKLKHELDDPNYLFANSRINRQAIIVRNLKIDELTEKLKTVQGI